MFGLLESTKNTNLICVNPWLEICYGLSVLTKVKFCESSRSKKKKYTLT